MKVIEGTFEESPLRCFSNVKEYIAIESDQFFWNISCDEEVFPNDTTKQIYFILDSNNHSAFSHWVFENFTWIPFFLKLKEEYPSCKVVVNDTRNFKDIFLRFIGIYPSSIVSRKDIHPENYCFFHTYISLNDPFIPTIYYKNIESYQTMFESFQPVKDIPILYLPRGTKENHTGPNNRIYNIQNNLKELVKDVGGVVYETDTTTSLEHQILLVKRAKCILLDYGSNLWVNGMFANNSCILCLNIGWKHHELFPSLHHLWYLISKTNTIKQIFAYPIPETISENEVDVVHFHMPTILHEIMTALEIPRDTL